MLCMSQIRQSNHLHVHCYCGIRLYIMQELIRKGQNTESNVCTQCAIILCTYAHTRRQAYVMHINVP